MSFYWQSAVPQESGQPTASTWDNINLGGTPSQPQQPAQQSIPFENQQPAQGGYEQYVNPYAAEWAAYHAQQAAAQQEHQTALAYQQGAAPAQPQIEHQPILTQSHQPALDSQSVTDQTTQESQSNHTAYDGWAHGEWSSHEPSVEPQVQLSAHEYYAQQQQQHQYSQEQTLQQPATIEQHWAPPSEVPSSTATIVESAPPSTVEIPPVEIQFESQPIVKEETLQPSPQPIHHSVQPSAPSAVLDMDLDNEITKEDEKNEEVEIKEEPQEELAEESARGWSEEWGGEEKDEEREEVVDSLHVPSTVQPRTSTPSPVEEQHEPELTVSPIETVVKSSAPSPSPTPVSPLIHPSVVMSAFPSPPTILAPSEIIAAPSSIDTKTSPLLNTDSTQKTSPPASTDSWVEVSSSGSDAVQLNNRTRGGGMGKDGVPPIASSSPARPEKRSSVSSTIGLVENGTERRREDSDSTHDSKRNVRDKFRDVKSQYNTIFARLEGHRSSGREGNKTPTRANPLLAAASNGGVKVGVAIATKNSSTPKEFHQDSTYPPALLNDLSVIEPSRMYGHMDHSANMSMESRGYGEELVDAYRKDRHRNMRTSRPASRAKSEYGDPLLMPDRGERHHHRSVYDHSHMMHAQYGYYPTGRYSLGRHSSMGMPYGGGVSFDDNRRPHSTYDHAAHMRMAQSGRGAEYDAFEYVSSREEESEEEEELPNESDNEMRRISHNAAAVAAAQAAQSRSSMGGMRRGMGGGGRAPMEGLGEMEIFYLGFVNMEVRSARRLLQDFPPSIEFWTVLDALERVAYLHYTGLHRKNFSVVSLFKDRFLERFLPLKRMGYAPQQALAKVCKEMRDHYNAKVTSNQRAYEASQRQLFSDEYDRGTPESRFSDRPSVYDHNQASDVDDASDYTPREPLKFRLPHAFATFGPGGKIIQVQPSKSIGTVHMTDIHCIVKDREMQRNVALANNFKGPLFPNQTPPHVVRAYITRQMDRIRRSDLAQTDPRNEDIIDCLLIWQLLEKVVQQHGKVTGPDMAELLTRASHHRREKGGGGGGSNTLEIAPPTPDPKAYENFSLYLLQGLVDDAINFAMGEGLFCDALALARRLVPHRVEEIEKRQFTTRPPSHPVLTLMAVASEEAAPCLSSMASEDRGGWRCHAAILFANLSNSPFAMETIRRLGEELARRECNAAADFCFLSVALLGGLDTFTPYTHDPITGLPPSVRRHIELIHASIPDDTAESTMCEYGFSLTDLHATEIFDYGSRLSGGATNLAISGPYQRRRIQYAKLLASWGGFALDSFRYCTEVARTMWEKMAVFTSRELTELSELAERLHKMASADEASTLWIESLNQMIPSIKTALTAPSFQAEASSSLPSATAPQSVPPPTQEEKQVKTEERQWEDRARSDSISTEAAAWHSRMGDEPLEMRSEKKEEERENENAPLYAAYHNQQQQQYQQQQQHSQYTAETMASESHHSSAFHQPQHGGEQQHPHNHHHHESHSQSHSATSHYDGYSSGTTTERGGGMSSEESTPVRERSASIHSSHSHSSHPNPLAPPSHHSPPAAAPSTQPPPSTTMRAPAPMPPMPSLAMVPTPTTIPTIATMQMQQQQPQLIKQETVSSHNQPPSSQQQQSLSGKAQNGGGGGGSGPGFFSRIKSSVITTVSKAAGNKEMILPDDSKKAIVYNPATGRYEGEGVEEETAPPPPPSIPGSMNGLSGMDGGMGGGGGGGGPPPMMMGGGLKAARNSGGSRYFNPMNDASKTAASSGPTGSMPPMGMPAPPTFPTQFSFIPTMPDDAVTDSPFSERPLHPEGTEGGQQETH